MIDDVLRSQLQRFVADHSQGWNHDDWLRLLFHLSESGVDTADEDAIGLALEQERLRQTLSESGVKGLGPKRIEAVADHFKTLWRLREASWEEVAEIKGVTKALAQGIVDRLKGD